MEISLYIAVGIVKCNFAYKYSIIYLMRIMDMGGGLEAGRLGVARLTDWWTAWIAV
jgi:hypothetical protein